MCSLCEVDGDEGDETLETVGADLVEPATGVPATGGDTPLFSACGTAAAAAVPVPAAAATRALLSSVTTAKTIQTAHTTAATTLYETSTAVEASERQRPSAPLIMPSGMARRPVQRCRCDQRVRRWRSLKRRWWRMPQMGWRRRAARTARPIIGWKLMESSSNWD